MNQCELARPNAWTQHRHPICRATAERAVGGLRDGPEIVAGTATRLQTLPGGRALYLTRSAELVEIAPGPNRRLLYLQWFSGSAEALWGAVGALYPGVQPGVSMPRFWQTEERVDFSGAVLYGVLDLLTLEVLEWECDQAAVRRRVEQANRDPEPYLSAIAQERVRDTLRSLLGFSAAARLPEAAR